MTGQAQARRVCGRGIPAATAAGFTTVATAALLLTSSARLPMTWDEGNSLRRAERIADWVGALSQDSESGGIPGRLACSPSRIRDGWWFVTRFEGHPALYGIVIALGQALARGLAGPGIDPLLAARCGPIALFASALGVFQYSLWRSHGPALALATTCGLLTFPRLFAHVQTASFDGPLTSCCMLSWALWHLRNRRPTACRRWHTVAWILCLGMMLSSKFTGWLMLIPYLVLGPNGGPELSAGSLRTALASRATPFAGALLVFVVLNPPLWSAPLTGIADFLWRNGLARDELGYDVATCFEGRIHSLARPLPWYNGPYWMIATLPTLSTPLALWGLARLRRFDPDHREQCLLAGNALLLPAVRALPLSPPHDAERLMLPCFPFLAILAAHGWKMLIHDRNGYRPRIAGGLSTAAFAIWIGSASTALLAYSPHWLSYYSLWVGGPRGAVQSGMEATYYWDAFDGTLRDWLRRRAGHSAIYVEKYPDDNLRYLRQWDGFWNRVNNRTPDDCRFYVFQNRPGMFSDVARCLLSRHTPLHVHRLRPWPPPASFGTDSPQRVGVPLIYVFQRAQYLDCRRCLNHQEREE